MRPHKYTHTQKHTFFSDLSNLANVRGVFVLFELCGLPLPPPPTSPEKNLKSQLRIHLEYSDIFCRMRAAGKCPPGNQLCVSFSLSFSRFLFLFLFLSPSLSFSLFSSLACSVSPPPPGEFLLGRASSSDFGRIRASSCELEFAKLERVRVNLASSCEFERVGAS